MIKRSEILIVILFILLVSIVSCHKKKNETPDDSSVQITNSSDQLDYLNETSQVIEDANWVVSDPNKNQPSSYAGIDQIDYTNITNGIYKFSYLGSSTPDHKRTRNGTVTVQLGPNASTSWNSSNAYMIINYNFSVTRTSNNSTMVFKGIKIVTNLPEAIGNHYILQVVQVWLATL